MDLLSSAAEGFSALLDIENATILLIATLIGLVGGVIPGVSGPMMVVVFLPITYAFEPTQAFILLTVIYAASVYGGMVTAILFRAPGTPESAMTVLDGYAMAQRGEAGRALGVGILASSTGAIIAAIAMIFLTAPLATLASSFSAAEFFAVALLGLSIVASLSSGQVSKGIFGVGLGMLLASVGNDPMTATQRMTFGVPSLGAGLELIPVMIGLFAIPEVLRKSRLNTNVKFSTDYGKVRVWSRENVRSVSGVTTRSGVIGTGVGILPGAGAVTAAILGYSQAVRFAKDKSRFGKGDPRGVAGPESANNAGAVGSLVPLFALGIPGSATTAILIGAFILHGFQPGPNMMSDQSEFVYTIFAAVLAANVIALIVARPLIGTLVRVLNVPYPILATGIIVFCVLGSYSLRNSTFDVWVMLVAGVLGYLLMQANFPVGTIVLGFVLGPIAESNFRRALMLSGGEWTVFFTRPISLTLISIALLVLLFPVLKVLGRRVLNLRRLSSLGSK